MEKSNKVKLIGSILIINILLILFHFEKNVEISNIIMNVFIFSFLSALFWRSTVRCRYVCVFSISVMSNSLWHHGL